MAWFIGVAAWTNLSTVADVLGSRILHRSRELRRFEAVGSRLGEGGERIGVVKRLAVRTGRLRRSPAVHSRPIDLVVSQEPSYPNGYRKPHLGGGFALRCLQRLSCPDLATRRCPERDSRHTRGRSSPILSY